MKSFKVFGLNKVQSFHYGLSKHEKKSPRKGKREKPFSLKLLFFSRCFRCGMNDYIYASEIIYSLNGKCGSVWRRRWRKKITSSIYTSYTIAETDVAKPKQIDARIHRFSRISSRFWVSKPSNTHKHQPIEWNSNQIF